MAKPILPQFSPIENVRTPQYLKTPEVSFSIVIPDSLGNKQEITYDGPLEGIENVGDIIKTLTNGNESELHTGEAKE